MQAFINSITKEKKQKFEKVEPDFSSELESLNMSFAFDPLKGKLCSVKKEEFCQVRPVEQTE